jgi:regulator of replication initiation timing
MSAIAIEGIKELSKQKTSMEVQIARQQEQIESTIRENQQLRSELDELKALVNTLVSNQTSQGNK